MLWYITINNEFMRGVPRVEKFNPSILDVVIVIKANGRIMSIFSDMSFAGFLYKQIVLNIL